MGAHLLLPYHLSPFGFGEAEPSRSPCDVQLSSVPLFGCLLPPWWVVKLTNHKTPQEFSRNIDSTAPPSAPAGPVCSESIPTHLVTARWLSKCGLGTEGACGIQRSVRTNLS